MHVCFVVFVLVFQYLAKGLAGKHISDMTYCVSGGMLNLTSINLFCSWLVRVGPAPTKEPLR